MYQCTIFVLIHKLCKTECHFTSTASLRTSRPFLHTQVAESLLLSTIYRNDMYHREWRKRGNAASTCVTYPKTADPVAYSGHASAQPTFRSCLVGPASPLLNGLPATLGGLPFAERVSPELVGIFLIRGIISVFVFMFSILARNTRGRTESAERKTTTFNQK